MESARTLSASVATRSKSPDRLVHDKVLERHIVSNPGPTPVERIWPAGLVAILADRCKTSRPRINRWLHNPDANPLTWPELQEIAAEAGGTLRVMFSTKCN